ncbi:MAG: ATP cone domain-containing protein, partial [Clostridia bacterium]|nr:ATP cone domain-containing protein [Clostridia bacterium]
MSTLNVYKRDGSLQPYNMEKITNAIFKAAQACGGNDKITAENLAKQVEEIIEKNYKSSTPTVEEIQNIVEKVLIENRHARVAKAFILYRESRNKIRDKNALIGAT